MVPAAKTKKATQPTARLRGKKVASAQKSPRVFRLGQSTTTGEIPSRKTEEKSEPLPAVPVAVVSPNGAVLLGAVSICNSKTRFWSVDVTDLDVLSGRFPFVLICNS